jgi:hypothetical protein
MGMNLRTGDDALRRLGAHPGKRAIRFPRKHWRKSPTLMSNWPLSPKRGSQAKSKILAAPAVAGQRLRRNATSGARRR